MCVSVCVCVCADVVGFSTASQMVLERENHTSLGSVSTERKRNGNEKCLYTQIHIENPKEETLVENEKIIKEKNRAVRPRHPHHARCVIMDEPGSGPF